MTLEIPNEVMAGIFLSWLSLQVWVVTSIYQIKTKLAVLSEALTIPIEERERYLKHVLKEKTRKESYMNKFKILLPFLAAFIIFGCATKNPQYTPILAGQPNTNTVPQYISDPRINSWSNTVSQVAGAVAPANPYAGLTSWGLTTLFGILGGVSAFVARQKSGTVNSLAASVVQAGAHPQVLEAAGNTPHFAAIADAINQNVAANQNLTKT